MLVLSRNDLEKILSMKEVIKAIEKAFLELYNRTAKVPLRIIIDIEKHKGTMLYMPCYLEENDALAIKVVSVYGENLKKGFPTIFATVLVNDPETGKPLAIMEGGYLTAMRTGATSGVATKYLARKDSRTVGIIGAGVQARTQLWAVYEVRPLKKVFVYDISMERAKSFADYMSKKLGIEIIIAKSPEEVVRNSDILILATTAKQPVIDGDWIREGTHINSIGWVGPEGRELDSKTVRKAKLIVDSKDAVLKESGDIIIPIKEGIIDESHIYAELGEIVSGAKKGRTSNEEITLFKSVGLAIEDAITAKLAYEKAIKENIGKEIEF
ncbi:ornithine cyclodeaminase family protein [Thermococcus paralvinellae]|uniref:Alanine dehydrogenase n=1 Tax=Thermococcus paralvinellae TaxID=582419 RepID=W0I356_9EURY|nr:hypothetical protein [Thermococcus paralvinellae]AHF80439.1 Ornithine cyclodeaminase [Thermococcus paralvinellae]